MKRLQKVIILFVFSMILIVNCCKASNEYDGKIEFTGNWGCSYNFTNNWVRIQGCQIENNKKDGTSGTLKLEVYFTSYYYNGGAISGYVVGEKTLGELNANEYYYEIDSTVSINSRPPSGYYHMVLVLSEYSDDGVFYIVDYISFDGLEVVN